jgi:hypothetical protein
MPKGNDLAEDLFYAVFNNVVASRAFASMGSGFAATGTPGSLYVSLHTSSPGIAGSQTTNEVGTGAWASYARQAVARASGAGGWTITDAAGDVVKVENASTISFAQNVTSSVTVKFAAVGTNSSGAGHLLYFAPLALATSQVFVVDDSVTNDNVTAVAHGLSLNDEVMFIDVVGAALPTEISESTVYYVQAVTNVDQFTIATTQSAGSPLALTNGSGRFAKVLQKTVGVNDTFSIDAGKLVILER